MQIVAKIFLKSHFNFAIYTKMQWLILEFKTCGLGSRIQDMETEWRLQFGTYLISYFIFGKQNWRDEPNIELKYQSVRRDMMFLAFNSLKTLEVENDHAHIIRQDI